MRYIAPRWKFDICKRAHMMLHAPAEGGYARATRVHPNLGIGWDGRAGCAQKEGCFLATQPRYFVHFVALQIMTETNRVSGRMKV